MAVFGSHGHCCEVHISNVDARESFSSQAVSRGRGVGLEDCSFPVNARDTKDGIPSEDRSPRRSPSISNSAWTRINVTTKREGDASQYDILDSPHAVTGNQNGVPINQELEPVIKVMRRCRADLEQHVAGTITDIEKGRNRGSTPMSHCSLEILRLIFKLILLKTMVRNLLGHVDGKSLLGRDSVNPGSASDDSCSDIQKLVISAWRKHLLQISKWCLLMRVSSFLTSAGDAFLYIQVGARKDSVQLLVLLSGFPFGTTALTTWNGFCLVEIQQSVVFTIKAEHQQSAAEHAKASPSLWSHDSLVDFFVIQNVEQYICYQLLDYEPV
ncbi:unnamed protein product [Sphagnum balticum]